MILKLKEIIGRKLKVAVYYNNNDVRIEQRPVPKISDGELLVKVRASGICGTDVMEWYRLKKAPVVLGHEMTGDISEIGPEVKDFKVGDRVFVSHHVPCNNCHYCLGGHHTACHTLHTTNYDPGGFSQFIRIPEINVKNGTLILPEKMSYEEGTFIEPLACVVRAQRIARLKAGCSVLILGSGISGVLHIKLAQAGDSEKIFATDISDHRLDFAKKLGAHPVKATEDVPAKLKEINDGRLADFVIVCTGAILAAHQALESVNNGGTIIFFAPPPPEVKLPLPVAELWRKEITLLTSYGAGPDDLQQALQLIKNGVVKVDDMITHRLSFDEIGIGFKLVAEADKSMKVIIEP